MDEFIERFKKWLDSEVDDDKINSWSLVDSNVGWTVGVDADGQELFVTVEPA